MMGKVSGTFVFRVALAAMSLVTVVTQKTTCSEDQAECKPTLINSIQALKEELMGDIRKLKATLEAKGRAIQSLKAAFRSPIISFRARIDTDLRVTYGDGVVFPIVDETIGTGYDGTTGVFTCPESGLYSFGLHLMARSGYMEFDLMKENMRLLSVIVHRTAQEVYWYADSATVPTYCRKGDSVRIVTRSPAQGSVVLHNLWNYFTGTLVHLDRDDMYGN